MISKNDETQHTLQEENVIIKCENPTLDFIEETSLIMMELNDKSASLNNKPTANLIEERSSPMTNSIENLTLTFKGPSALTIDSVEKRTVVYNNPTPDLSAGSSSLTRASIEKITSVNPTPNVIERSSLVLVDGKRTSVCNICKKVYANESNCIRHIQKVHFSNDAPANKNPCQLCSESFLNKADLTKHILKHHDEHKPHQCDLCSKVFKTAQILKMHMITHTDVRPYTCDLCNKSFKRKESFRVHRFICSSERSQHVCHVCSKVFCYRGLLTHHYNKVHNTESVECQPCQMKFPSDYLLRKHKEEYHGVTPYKLKCPYCPKVYTKASELSLHKKRNHIEIEKSYMCETCGKILSSHSSLKDHQLIHTNVKSFECNDCGKLFRNKQALTVHVVVHTKERNYECSFCDKKFTQSSTLRTHLRKHTGEKPYKCYECDEAFALKTSLHLHTKRKHDVDRKPNLDNIKLL